ncbi:hypothetical protein [Amycolatopsis sp.]|uniref:hypothetical protein n=1 Tax=Amycolatopsis sp. TaxID=37632 RepID=UPI002C46B4D6|nr:hypothetical protein [Amycolatopsis sp.]HVV11594.1 hypothetical protein [Amycolatopsis sp.]
MAAKVQHPYSPEQYTRVVELWRRLLDCHIVEAYEVQAYGRLSHVGRIDDVTLYELVLSDGEETGDLYPVTLNLVSYSDYGGSDIDAANVRALKDVPGVIVSDIDFGGKAATATLGELPDTEDTEDGINRLESLVYSIEHIAEYVLLDEETHSEYVTELAEEAWDQYLGSDVLSEVETALGLDDTLDTLDVFGFSEDDIRELYYGFEGTEFYAETATSVVNANHVDAIAYVVGEIVEAWRKPYVDPAQLSLI